MKRIVTLALLLSAFVVAACEQEGPLQVGEVITSEDTMSHAGESEVIVRQLECSSGNLKALEFYNDATIKLAAGELEVAHDLYLKAIEADPKFCDAMDNLGLLLRRQGMLDEAIDWYRKSLELQDENPVAHINLAVAYKMLGDYDSAQAEYERLIELDPEDPEGYYGLATILFEEEKYQQAIDELELAEARYLEVDSPWIVDAWTLLGRSCLELGNSKRAKDYFDAAFKIDDRNPQTNYGLGLYFLFSDERDLFLAEHYMIRAAAFGFDVPDTAFNELGSWEISVAEDVTVLRGTFGYWDIDEDGTFLFIPSFIVPNEPGTSYGWILSIDSNKPTVQWREEFELPEAPESWGSAEDDPELEILQDGKLAVIETESSLDEGFLYHDWIVAEGDPYGTYELRIYVEGTYVTTFSFDVVEP